MQLSESDLRELSRQAMQQQGKSGPFWTRKGWLRYPLLGLLLVVCAVALRGSFWSQTPAKAAKRAAQRSAMAKAKKLPKVQMLLEHNERDINLRIKKGKHQLPRPVINRSDRKVTIELAGVQVRPRKWTLAGSRVASINVNVTKKGSTLVITQDPKVAGKLKDAFSAEDIDGNLVLRVLNESIGDRAAGLPKKGSKAPSKVAHASTAPPKKSKAKHPLGRRLSRKSKASQTKDQAKDKSKDELKVEAQPVQAEPAKVDTTPSAAPRTYQQPSAISVVEHPAPTPAKPASAEPALNETPSADDTLLKSALSLTGSILAFGLLALVPLLWWKKKQMGPSSHLKITERMALSPKHSLVKVQLGGQELWLGLSEGNIQLISPATMNAPRVATNRAAQSNISNPVHDAPSTQRELFEEEQDSEPASVVPLRAPAPPPTMARRKLQAFKSRLREALAQPELHDSPAVGQDAGRQADAIRRELQRRQAQGHRDLGQHRDVA